MTEDCHNGTTDLHLAIARRDRDALEQLLARQDELLDARNQDGMTPLHLAAYLGDDDVLCLLLRLGAQVDERDLYGRTPLYIAASQQHIEVVKQLLHAGADPDIGTMATFEAIEVPLHTAARAGNTELISFLLSHGADPSITDDLGRTPACLAQQSGQLQAAKIFGLFQHLHS